MTDRPTPSAERRAPSAESSAECRAVINPFRERGPFPQPSRQAVRALHRSLPGYVATPLVRRTALARSLGLEDLYVKYEGARFGLMAFKGLGASWALHRLLETRGSGLGTVSTASEGNHGRAVAWAARLMQRPCVIFLPSHAASQRIENIRREGARVVLVDGMYEDAVRQCDRDSRANGWQIISDVGYDGYLEIPLLVAEGYSTMYQEIDEQLASAGWRRPDVVLIPGGVGALLQAGVDHYRAGDPSPRVVGVEPAEGDCLTESLASPQGAPAISRGSGRTTMACLNCAEVSLPNWPPIRRGVDVMVTIEDRYAEEGVRRLYRAESGDGSLEAGNSGAATTGALIALAQDARLRAARDFLQLGPKTIAIAICTEGAIDRTEFERVIRS